MTPAILQARKAGVAFSVHEYAHDPSAPSYGEEAAERLGVEPGRVFKTLLAELDTGALAVGIVPVSTTLSLKSLAAALGARRAAMADVAAAERATGYVAGGISPIGQRKRLRTVLDESALAWETVFVSAGRRGLELELAPAELVRLTGAVVASIGR